MHNDIQLKVLNGHLVTAAEVISVIASPTANAAVSRFRGYGDYPLVDFHGTDMVAMFGKKMTVYRDIITPMVRVLRL